MNGANNTRGRYGEFYVWNNRTQYHWLVVVNLFPLVNTIKSIRQYDKELDKMKIATVQEKRQRNDQRYGMQVGEEQFKKTRVGMVATHPKSAGGSSTAHIYDEMHCHRS